MKTFQMVAYAIAFAMPLLASAQTTPGEGPAAPTNAQLTFKSAFSDYRPYEDVSIADWRQVNDTVRQAATKGSGHAGHDAANPSDPGSTAPGGAPAQSPTPDQKHMGHGMHGGQQ